MLQPVQLSVLLPLQSFARVFAGLDKRAGDRSRNLGRTRAMAAAGKMDVLDTMEGRKALQAMAAYLGIDGTNEKQLMWIAERALMAPLPRNWEEISTPDGKVRMRNANALCDASHCAPPPPPPCRRVTCTACPR
jgi:hypothetical protein